MRHGEKAGGALPMGRDETADIGRLARMLPVVCEDTDQTYPEGHGRVPRVVDDAFEVGPGETGDVPDGLLEDGLVVAEQLGRVRADGSHFVVSLTVTGGLAVEREIEARAPSFSCPDLFDAGGGCHMVILDPGQMPHEPPDRIGAVGRAVSQLLGGEPVEDALHRVVDPSERIDQQVRDVHGWTWLGPG